MLGDIFTINCDEIFLFRFTAECVMESAHLLQAIWNQRQSTNHETEGTNRERIKGMNNIIWTSFDSD